MPSLLYDLTKMIGPGKPIVPSTLRMFYMSPELSNYTIEQHWIIKQLRITILDLKITNHHHFPPNIEILTVCILRNARDLKVRSDILPKTLKHFYVDTQVDVSSICLPNSLLEIIFSNVAVCHFDHILPNLTKLVLEAHFDEDISCIKYKDSFRGRRLYESEFVFSQQPEDFFPMVSFCQKA